MAERTHISIAAEPGAKGFGYYTLCGDCIDHDRAEFDQDWFEPGTRFQLPVNTLAICRNCLRIARDWELPDVPVIEGRTWVALVRRKAQEVA